MAAHAAKAAANSNSSKVFGGETNNESNKKHQIAAKGSKQQENTANSK